MAETRVIRLKARPLELPGPEHFDITIAPRPTPKASEALVRIEAAALSPWQGQRLKDFRNYTKPFEIGEIIDGDVLGRVVQSNTPALPEGAKVAGRLGWREYAIATPSNVEVVASGQSAETTLVTLSSPGLTAYAGLNATKRGMAGETLIVTSAAGGVGSHVVQLGKMAGMRVIGLAGGETKRRIVQDQLGADIALDYRAPNLEQRLAEAMPNGFDLFYDTVGGTLADQIFEHTSKFATIVLVGRTAANNSADPASDMANMRVPWGQNATIIGFNRYDRPLDWAEARTRMERLAQNGKIDSLVTWADGFEAAPQALQDMLAGRNVGKTLVRFHG